MVKSEVDKLKTLIHKRDVIIKELKKEVNELLKSEDNVDTLKAEIKLLRTQHKEFRELAEQAGSECAKYRHELERLKK